LKLKNKNVYSLQLTEIQQPMKHLLVASLGIIALTTFNSCRVERDIVLNAADKVCSPGIKEKGELYIDGSRKMKSTGYAGTSSCWSGDIAYAVQDHMALMASVRTLDEHFESQPKGFAPNEQTRVFNLTGMRADLAIGYITGIRAYGKFEAYMGLGGGEVNNTSTYPSGYSVSHLRAFGQFGFGFDNHVISLMCGARLAGQSHGDLNKLNPADYPEIRTAIVKTPRKYDVLFLDPYAEAQVGYKFIKLSMQVGCNNVIPYDLNTIEKNRYFLSGFYFTTGIAIRFAPRNSRKKVWGAKKYWEI
jgi:hypothetical protein